ncbi:mucin-5AC [Fukomys damarensis]|uniref:mucin-5AC n=1 Tax=Fukomys damarensis TaxID=885580 RepID=UPI0014554649|nr:mucin-5AC [Fukomys damarensis]
MGFSRGMLALFWAMACAQNSGWAQEGSPKLSREISPNLSPQRGHSGHSLPRVTVIPPLITIPVRALNPAHTGRVCSTWGDFHYKTFDGAVFRFPGLCNYVFSSHCGAAYEDFNVQLRRGRTSNGTLPSRVIMKLNGMVVELTRDSVLVNGHPVQLPFSQAGVLIEHSSGYLKVVARLGLVFVWNLDGSLTLELDTRYVNKTCGLCGDFNGIAEASEFLSPNARLTPLEFGNLQKMDGPTEQCQDPSPAPQNCSNSTGICEELLSSQLFAGCAALVNVSSYIEACWQDLCHCESAHLHDCLCHTLAEFSRQCAHAGGQPPDWRSPNLCAPMCSSGMRHQECGSPCTDTCSNPQRSQLCEEHCVAGCFCPGGTVLDDVRHTGCVPVSQCACVYNGTPYAPGANYSTDCAECTCVGGHWSCRELPCPGTCSVLGGAHFSTFDEKQYTVHGDCSYVLTKLCDSSAFAVLAELRRCGLTDSETCLKSVTLSLGGGQTVVVVKTSGEVFVNQIYTQLPVSAANVTILKPSTFFIIVETKLGLQLHVQLVPTMQLFVRLAPELQGQTCGLCGNFNHNQADDFRTISGVVEGTGTAFANTWKTQASCPNAKTSFEDPCSLSVENEKYAQHWCSLLTDVNSPFAQCHAAVSPSSYHSNCVFDTCNCERSEDCLCAALSSYVHACAAKGVLLRGWRDGVCMKPTTTCPKSMAYQEHLGTCQPTCRSLSEADVTCGVSFVPVDGCTCPAGTFLDEAGACVPAHECPCYHGGSMVPNGESIHDSGALCTCTRGVLTCIGGSAPSPVCDTPMVYFDCRNTTLVATGAGCQKSCHTLDMACYSTQCVSGCICPPGLVADGDGGCVAEEDCPCVHNEASYRSGETILDGCNTCTCENRMWQCTEEPCLATCAVYGDGHFLTFDGQRYTFNGACEYTLVQDQCGGNSSALDTFRVVTENVPCGTTGTTCSKDIKIFLGSSELKLSSGKVEVVQMGARQEPPYTVRQMGIYLAVDTDTGLELLWDRKTSLFLRLSPKFKGRVCGLCGNFDGNAINDLTTRSQAVVSDALEFGNSWKFSPTCPDAPAPKDPCTANPYRKGWAQRQCSIINSAIFAACHAHVEPAKYYEACVSDACACDSGGDCECFCTAVAAYAQTCHEVGVCVSWRTPDICPLFCDYYNLPGECEWHYEPCGAPCLRTCRNPSGRCLQDLRGLEGCYPKCPLGAPIFDEDKMQCVAECLNPTPVPHCHIQGKSYRVGAMVPSGENCHSCICTESGVHCSYDTEACFCTYNGQRFWPGAEIYHTTDGMDGCLSASCGVNGTIERRVYSCSSRSTAPPTTFIFSTAPVAKSSTHSESTQPSPTRSTAHSSPQSSTMPSATHTSAGETLVVASTDCGKECVWSPWLDISRPGRGIDSGDFDTLENLRAHGHELCQVPMEVQCRAEDVPEVPLSVLGQRVECSPTVGLTCHNRDQMSGLCDNYQVRVLCCHPVPCSVSSGPTAPSSALVTITGPATIPRASSAPAPGSPTPERAMPSTSSMKAEPTTLSCSKQCSWTEWIDSSYPAPGRDSGDFDTLVELRGHGYKFCERPQSVECRAQFFPNTPLAELGQKVTCNPEVGLLCLNREQLPPICYNYQIRIECCEVPHSCKMTASTSETSATPQGHEYQASTSTQAVQTPGTHTVTLPGTTGCQPQCTWTPWLDVDSPEPGPHGGDLETYSHILQRGHSICRQPEEVTRLQCRAQGHPEVPITILGQVVQCDIEVGLVCHNSDQQGPEGLCLDYELDPLNHSNNQLDTLNHHRNEFDPQNHNRNQLEPVNHNRNQLSPLNHHKNQLNPQNHNRNQFDPLNYDKNQLDPLNHHRNHRPGRGIDSGDFDTLENLRAHGHELCQVPMEVQCRAEDVPEVPLSVLGQRVECSPTVGLTCHNRDQMSGLCDNYQVRVLCCHPVPCSVSSGPTAPSSALVTITGPATIPRASSAPAPGSPTPERAMPSTSSMKAEPTTLSCSKQCSWTEWIDSSYPAPGRDSGDFDTLVELRGHGYKFCERPQSVECRAQFFPNTPLAELGQKVTCNPEVGLLCLNREQLPPICYNYQIRIECCEVPHSCKMTASTSETSATPQGHEYQASTSTQAVQTPGTHTVTLPGTTGCQPQCTWTPWLDVDSPEPGPHGGDLETYSHILQRGHSICRQPEEVTRLQCRAQGHPEVPITILGQVVQCDIEVGLVCHNSDQQGPEGLCLDYELDPYNHNKNQLDPLNHYRNQLDSLNHHRNQFDPLNHDHNQLDPYNHNKNQLDPLNHYRNQLDSLNHHRNQFDPLNHDHNQLDPYNHNKNQLDPLNHYRNQLDSLNHHRNQFDPLNHDHNQLDPYNHNKNQLDPLNHYRNQLDSLNHHRNQFDPLNHDHNQLDPYNHNKNQLDPLNHYRNQLDSLNHHRNQFDPLNHDHNQLDPYNHNKNQLDPLNHYRNQLDSLNHHRNQFDPLNHDHNQLDPYNHNKNQLDPLNHYRNQLDSLNHHRNQFDPLNHDHNQLDPYNHNKNQLDPLNHYRNQLDSLNHHRNQFDPLNHDHNQLDPYNHNKNQLDPLNHYRNQLDSLNHHRNQFDPLNHDHNQLDPYNHNKNQLDPLNHYRNQLDSLNHHRNQFDPLNHDHNQLDPYNHNKNQLDPLNHYRNQLDSLNHHRNHSTPSTTTTTTSTPSTTTGTSSTPKTATGTSSTPSTMTKTRSTPSTTTRTSSTPETTTGTSFTPSTTTTTSSTPSTTTGTSSTPSTITETSLMPSTTATTSSTPATTTGTSSTPKTTTGTSSTPSTVTTTSSTPSTTTGTSSTPSTTTGTSLTPLTTTTTSSTPSTTTGTSSTPSTTTETSSTPSTTTTTTSTPSTTTGTSSTPKTTKGTSSIPKTTTGTSSTPSTTATTRSTPTITKTTSSTPSTTTGTSSTPSTTTGTSLTPSTTTTTSSTASTTKGISSTPSTTATTTSTPTTMTGTSSTLTTMTTTSSTPSTTTGTSSTPSGTSSTPSTTTETSSTPSTTTTTTSTPSTSPGTSSAPSTMTTTSSTSSTTTVTSSTPSTTATTSSTSSTTTVTSSTPSTTTGTSSPPSTTTGTSSPPSTTTGTSSTPSTSPGTSSAPSTKTGTSSTPSTTITTTSTPSITTGTSSTPKTTTGTSSIPKTTTGTSSTPSTTTGTSSTPSTTTGTSSTPLTTTTTSSTPSTTTGTSSTPSTTTETSTTSSTPTTTKTASSTPSTTTGTSSTPSTTATTSSTTSITTGTSSTPKITTGASSTPSTMTKTSSAPSTTTTASSTPSTTTRTSSTPETTTGTSLTPSTMTTTSSTPSTTTGTSSTPSTMTGTSSTHSTTTTTSSTPSTTTGTSSTPSTITGTSSTPSTTTTTSSTPATTTGTSLTPSTTTGTSSTPKTTTGTSSTPSTTTGTSSTPSTTTTTTSTPSTTTGTSSTPKTTTGTSSIPSTTTGTSSTPSTTTTTTSTPSTTTGTSSTPKTTTGTSSIPSTTTGTSSTPSTTTTTTSTPSTTTGTSSTPKTTTGTSSIPSTTTGTSSTPSTTTTTTSTPSTTTGTSSTPKTTTGTSSIPSTTTGTSSTPSTTTTTTSTPSTTTGTSSTPKTTTGTSSIPSTTTGTSSTPSTTTTTTSTPSTTTGTSSTPKTTTGTSSIPSTTTGTSSTPSTTTTTTSTPSTTTGTSSTPKTTTGTSSIPSTTTGTSSTPSTTTTTTSTPSTTTGTSSTPKTTTGTSSIPSTTTGTSSTPSTTTTTTSTPSTTTGTSSTPKTTTGTSSIPSTTTGTSSTPSTTTTTTSTPSTTTGTSSTPKTTTGTSSIPSTTTGTSSTPSTTTTTTSTPSTTTGTSSTPKTTTGTSSIPSTTTGTSSTPSTTTTTTSTPSTTTGTSSTPKTTTGTSSIPSTTTGTSSTPSTTTETSSTPSTTTTTTSTPSTTTETISTPKTTTGTSLIPKTTTGTSSTPSTTATTTSTPTTTKTTSSTPSTTTGTSATPSTLSGTSSIPSTTTTTSSTPSTTTGTSSTSSTTTVTSSTPSTTATTSSTPTTTTGTTSTPSTTTETTSTPSTMTGTSSTPSTTTETSSTPSTTTTTTSTPSTSTGTSSAPSTMTTTSSTPSTTTGTSLTHSTRTTTSSTSSTTTVTSSTPSTTATTSSTPATTTGTTSTPSTTTETTSTPSTTTGTSSTPSTTTETSSTPSTTTTTTSTNQFDPQNHNRNQLDPLNHYRNQLDPINLVRNKLNPLNNNKNQLDPLNHNRNQLDPLNHYRNQLDPINLVRNKLNPLNNNKNQLDPLNHNRNQLNLLNHNSNKLDPLNHSNNQLDPRTTSTPSTLTETTSTPSTTTGTSSTPSTTTGTSSTPSTPTVTSSTPSTTATTSSTPATTTGTTSTPSTLTETTSTPSTTTGTSSTPSTTTGTSSTPSTPTVTSSTPSTTATTSSTPATTTGTTSTPSTLTETTSTPSTTTGTSSTPSTTTGTSSTPSTPTVTSSTPSTTATTSSTPATTTGTTSTPSTLTETTSTPSTTTGTSSTPSTTTGTSSTPSTPTVTSSTPSTTATTSSTPATTTGTTSTPSTLTETTSTPSTTTGTSSTPSTTTGTSSTPSTPTVTSSTPSTTATTSSTPATTTGTTSTPSTLTETTSTPSTTTGTSSTPSTTTGTSSTPSTPTVTSSTPSTTATTSSTPATTTGTTSTPSTLTETTSTPSTTTGTSSTPSTTTGTSSTPSTTTGTRTSSTPSTTTETSSTPSTTTTTTSTPSTTTGTSSTPKTTTGTSSTPSTTTGTSSTPSTMTGTSSTPSSTTGTSSTPLTTTTTSSTPSTTTGTSSTPSTTTGTSSTPSTTATTSSTPTITKTTSSTPSTTTGTSCKPQCTWTPWLDVDSPEPGPHGGDLETYSHILQRGHSICHQPEEVTRLQCRAQSHPEVPIAILGQVVQCDRDVGLVCHNRDQQGPEGLCLDYEVRVLCCRMPDGCPSTTVTSTVTSHIETLSSALSSTVSSSSVVPSSSNCFCHVSGQLYPAGLTIYHQRDLDGHCYHALCSWDCHVIRGVDPTCPPLTTAPTPTPPVTPTSSSDACLNVVPQRKKDETWEMPNCSQATCKGDNIVSLSPRLCPELTPPLCANGYPALKVADADGCCKHYQCQCVCSGWGDPHYITFDGTYYTFLDDCTYVLVQQIVPVFGHFRVLVDNDFCDVEDRVSCPQSIIVEYHGDRVVLTRRLVGGAMTNQILFNGEVVSPGFQKNGIAVSRVGIKMYVSIRELGVQVMFSGLIFSVEVPFSKFANNTEGQCGTCTNDKKDECRMPGGALATSCSEMSRHWRVDTPQQAFCRGPPPTPTSAPLGPSAPTHPQSTLCPSSPICELILSKVFELCHSVIEPLPFFEGCVFDHCHETEVEVVCSGLELYASLCAAEGVCVDWRAHTNDSCPFPCPSDKVYQPCGLSDPPYCYRSDNASSLALPEASRITEGCFCPDNLKLFSDSALVCVPEDCPSCPGPHGEPVQPGQVISKDCQECVCDPLTKSMTCQQKACPPPPACHTPGFVSVSTLPRAGQCCPQYSCVCNSSYCPKLQACPRGSHPVLIHEEGACCPSQNCSWVACSINGTLYQPGAVVSSSLCETCRCEVPSGPKWNSFVVSCETKICNTHCPMGFGYQPRHGQCCGECIQKACVVALNGTGEPAHLLNPGESWSDPGNPCVQHTCERFQDQLEVVTVKRECPPLSCPRAQAQLSQDGCCLLCPQVPTVQPQEWPCTLRHREQVLQHQNCSSATPVRLAYCEGICGESTSKYSLEANAVEHRCRCCQEQRTSSRTVTLRCADGSTRAFSYTQVEECGCQGLQCQAPTSREAESGESQDQGPRPPQ